MHPTAALLALNGLLPFNLTASCAGSVNPQYRIKRGDADFEWQLSAGSGWDTANRDVWNQNNSSLRDEYHPIAWADIPDYLMDKLPMSVLTSFLIRLDAPPR